MPSRAAKKAIASKDAGGTPPAVSEEAGEDLVADADWVDYEALPFPPESYCRLKAFGLEFRDSMVNDRAHWADSKAMDAKSWAVRAIASAVAFCVQPRIVDFHNFRVHVASHLQRLCLRRQRFEADTMHRVEELVRGFDRLDARFSRWEARERRSAEDLEACLEQLRTRCNEMNMQIAALDRRLYSVEAASVVDISLARPAQARGHRSRSPSLESHVREAMDPRELILSAQLAAISRRSRSPGPDSAAVMREFSNQSRPCEGTA